jgi:hypothetical protein
MIRNKIDIVLRTHTSMGLFDQKVVPRIVSDVRLTMILKCVTSLVNSINQSDKDIILTVLDNHSPAQDAEKIKSLVSKCKVPVNFYTTKVHDFNSSFLEQYTYGRDHGRELVYFLDDDYLHAPNAIDLIVNAYNHFRSMSGFSEVAISPWDQPDEYEIKHSQPCKMFHFEKHYWRSTISASNTSLWPIEAIRGGWHLFEKLALEYGKVAGVEELSTIGQLLNNAVNHRGPVCCFSPIPSAALHIHHLGQGTPKEIDTKMFDWQKRWEEIVLS